MADKIYVVTHRANGGEPRLVQADNKAQALNFVAKDILQAELAAQDTLFDLASKGVRLEKAASAQAQLPV